MYFSMGFSLELSSLLLGALVALVNRLWYVLSQHGLWSHRTGVWSIYV